MAASGMTVPALVVTSLGMIFLLLAYASPNWVQSYEAAENPFVKCGLWEFCFNDYTFPADFKGRRWIGCWYIFSADIRDMWEYLSPPWFISVEVMMSVVCLAQIGCFVIVFLVLLRCLHASMNYNLLNLATVAILVAAALSLISLAVFGHFKESRRWMYRPDQNFLSWSFGCAVIAMLFQLIQGALFWKMGKQCYEEGIKNPPAPPMRSYDYEMKPGTTATIKMAADRFFKYGFILSLISALCVFVSFVTPYWMEQRQYGDSKHKFIRCGLWQFCLNEWNFPQDYMGKNYSGCWYIFAREYDYVRKYMLPGWFIAVQFFMSLNMLIAGLACLIQVQYLLGSLFSPLYQKVSCFLSFFSAALSTLSVTIFGVRSQDRFWMPQPDRNFHSWSFGICVLAGFFSVFSGMSLIVSCLRDHFFNQPEEHYGSDKRRD
ncbi:uncharacterized protein LOC135463362 [Liolophura sinensis]|uniref:uncharacterized protein LOC135463362 n=1 Tax=Liolophura sinensis TaxID=3198878 RepID=UPI0031582740